MQGPLSRHMRCYSTLDVLRRVDIVCRGRSESGVLWNLVIIHYIKTNHNNYYLFDHPHHTVLLNLITQSITLDFKLFLLGKQGLCRCRRTLTSWHARSRATTCLNSNTIYRETASAIVEATTLFCSSTQHPFRSSSASLFLKLIRFILDFKMTTEKNRLDTISTVNALSGPRDWGSHLKAAPLPKNLCVSAFEKLPGEICGHIYGYSSPQPKSRALGTHRNGRDTTSTRRS